MAALAAPAAVHLVLLNPDNQTTSASDTVVAASASIKAEVFIQSVHFKMGEALPWNTKLERKKASSSLLAAHCCLLQHLS